MAANNPLQQTAAAPQLGAPVVTYTGTAAEQSGDNASQNGAARMLWPEMKAAVEAHAEGRWLRYFLVWGVLRAGLVTAGWILAGIAIVALLRGEPVLAEMLKHAPWIIGGGAFAGLTAAYCAREAVRRVEAQRAGEHGRQAGSGR